MSLLTRCDMTQPEMRDAARTALNDAIDRDNQISLARWAREYGANLLDAADRYDPDAESDEIDALEDRVSTYAAVTNEISDIIGGALPDDEIIKAINVELGKLP